jgi:U32 family peptidase
MRGFRLAFYHIQITLFYEEMSFHKKDSFSLMGTIPELLIPAGTVRKLQVALAYGADAVYVGAAGFSMRPDGASFTMADLRRAIPLVHEQNKKIYVGMNSLIFQNEIDEVRAWLEASRDVAIDALIVADPATFRLAREIRSDLELHISTQMSIANALAAEFWKEQGASRVILARECSLEQARQIANAAQIPVEIFIHGAMCVAVSGRCLLSAHMTGHNASRGDCKHSCRWQWELTEAKRPGESYPVIQTEKETVFLSSTDLCLIEHIPAVVKSGVASLKVEGRMKSEFYVACITRAYRAALDAYAADPEHYALNPAWLEDVNAVRHHPYATGFAFGYPTENPEKLQASYIDIGAYDFVGLVEAVQEPALTVHVKHPFRYDEVLEWMHPNGSRGTLAVDSITLDGQRINQAHPGTLVQVMIEENVSLPECTILRRRKPGSDTGRWRVE